jgi:Ala-tRNA(Pro) deacylase
MLKSLEKLLKTNKIKYELMEHRKVYTAWDEAQTQHVNPKEVAKAVVVRLDKNLAIAVLPAAKKSISANLQKSQK